MNPGGTGKPRRVSVERFAPLPPLCSIRPARGSSKANTRLTRFLPPAEPRHHPQAGGAQGESDENVDEVVIPQVDRGDPQAEARKGIEIEAPPPVREVEEQDVARQRAMEAGEDVDAVAA